MRNFAIAFFLLLGQADGASAAGRRVAVIFNGGDGGDLRAVVNAREQAAAEFYRSRGYEVVVLSAENRGATPEKFRQTLAGLRGVEDLQLDFIAHGAVVPPGPPRNLDRTRFPVTTLSEGQYASRYPFEGTERRNQFELPVEGAKDPLGLQDIRGSLEAFQRANPASVTTLLAGNCFSGHLSQELSDLPRFRAFVSTAAQTVAPICKAAGGEDQDQMMWMKESLQAGASYREAQLHAQKRQLEACPETDGLPFSVRQFLLPRNSMQGYIEKWCRDRRPASPRVHRSPDPATSTDFEHLVEPTRRELAEVRATRVKLCDPALEVREEAQARAHERDLHRRILASIRPRMNRLNDANARELVEALEKKLAMMEAAPGGDERSVSAEEKKDREETIKSMRERIAFLRAAPNLRAAVESDMRGMFAEVERCQSRRDGSEQCKGILPGFLFEFGTILGVEAPPPGEEENQNGPDIAEKDPCGPSAAPQSAREVVQNLQSARRCRLAAAGDDPVGLMSALDSPEQNYRAHCHFLRGRERELDGLQECSLRFYREASAPDKAHLRMMLRLSREKPPGVMGDGGLAQPEAQEGER